MPNACSVGNDERGNCTGIAVDVVETDVTGVEADVSGTGVNGDVVVGVEGGPLVDVVAADGRLVVGMVVARAGGRYCVMAEFSGME